MAIIGIDATALSEPACGGIGTSQYQTMRALAELDTPHRFVLYAVSPPAVPFSGEPLDLPWALRLGQGWSARRNSLWMQTGINRLLAADRVEVFWGPRHMLPFRAHGISKVATIHDFWHRLYPGHQPWRYRTVDRALITATATRADIVVTPSLATARDAERFCGVALDNVRVVPWGVDPAIFRPLPAEQTRAVAARLGIEGPYVLSLDVFNPRKNFSLVLEAVARIPATVHRPVAVVGLGRPRRNALRSNFQARADALGLSERLRLPGDVSPEDLVALYCGALAFGYPSFQEGFGMPVLEAMACGCPVITANTSSLPEVAGDAAVLVDPSSADELARAITLLATDNGERARFTAAGKARAKSFTWRATAEGMLAAFDQALAARKMRTSGARSR